MKADERIPILHMDEEMKKNGEEWVNGDYKNHIGGKNGK